MGLSLRNIEKIKLKSLALEKIELKEMLLTLFP